jgi:hypothetical protein
MDALFGGFPCVFNIDDVVKHHAAIGMRGLDDLQRRP